MDPEFVRPLTIVLLIGSAIGGIAGVTLFIIFRQFGEEKAGKSAHVGLMAALLGFVFLICIALFMLSYAEK